MAINQNKKYQNYNFFINLGQGSSKNQLEPRDFALIDRAITPEERRRFSGKYSNQRIILLLEKFS